ncbi:J domain-containing protein [Heracleum sosnowskyi]|uniref:J domain-containing protein n=1 Tax=Heracleum sosnowskyi TaxID=360622 RepID=A0AAD8GVC0_9APIA|nr:J domain-containing protein [Heracleum sosnowskyi]
MHCSSISGNNTIIFHLSPKPHKFQPSSFISFNTLVRNPNFVVKSWTNGSYKSRTKASINTIAPPQSTESFYELLGIPESGSLSDIKKAYKQLARKYHPDVSPPERSEEYTQRFILVQEAYETLADPQTRASYDKDMSKGLHFSFSARRRVDYHQTTDERGEWKNKWMSQLSELKHIRMNDNNIRESWGSRMRRQHSE